MYSHFIPYSIMLYSYPSTSSIGITKGKLIIIIINFPLVIPILEVDGYEYSIIEYGIKCEYKYKVRV